MANDKDFNNKEKAEGKRVLLCVSLSLDVLSAICLIIAFITPYWVISWPRVYSGFRRLGLWEACFYGYIIPWAPERAYHGCWWIMAPELYYIRDWLMPPWFIVVQILMSISVFIELLNIILTVILWVTTSKKDQSGLGKKRARYDYVQTTMWICAATAILKSMSVIIFGIAWYYDPFWLTQKNLTYPHASYGLAILSAIFSIFSCISHINYRRLVREEDYKNPTLQYK